MVLVSIINYKYTIPAILISLKLHQTHIQAFTMPSKPKILCCGISTLDTIATLDEFPSPDAKVRSKTLHNYGGGNAANTAVAISRLGRMKVDLLTAVGNDANGDTIIKELAEENVGVENVQRYNGDSPYSYIMVAKDTRTIIHQPASSELSVSYVEDTVDLSEYSAVHFDVRHPEAAVYLSKKCRDMGIPYSVDVERPREGLIELLQGATVVICNSDYCSLALGLPKDSGDEIEMVSRFQKVLKEQAPNAKIGVMTMGSSGSFLIQNKVEYGNNNEVAISKSTRDGSPQVLEKCSSLWCDIFSNCEVVDTTGAGDSFQGGFLSAFWTSRHYHTCTPEDPYDRLFLAHALRIGTAVAAMKVQKTGARAGLPNAEDRFLNDEFECMGLHM